MEQVLQTLPGDPSSSSIVSGADVAPSLVFCVLFCRSLFVFVSIVLSVLRFTVSDYQYGMFKLFLHVLSLNILPSEAPDRC